MNKEIQITIISCAIIFASIGFVVYDMNSNQITTPQTMPNDLINKPVEKLPYSTQDTIIKQTITYLNIPANNTLPWGVIKGAIINPAQGHPIIIQFFKSLDDSPVHIAQVDLKDDNSFEYKFRLLSIDDDVISHIFEGDYQIKIFRTVIAP